MPLFNGNVTKYRLNGPQAFTVLSSSCAAVYFYLHFVRVADDIG